MKTLAIIILLSIPVIANAHCGRSHDNYRIEMPVTEMTTRTGNSEYTTRSDGSTSWTTHNGNTSYTTNTPSYNDYSNDSGYDW